jgi:putative thioredoxin
MSQSFSFDKEVLEGSRQLPVLVDFWAPWCGPCQTLTPVLEEMAGESTDRWSLVKVNVDQYPDIASRYQVQSIPTGLLFHKGQLLASFQGAYPKPQLVRWLEQHIPNPLVQSFSELEAHIQNPWEVRADTLERMEQLVRHSPSWKEGRLKLARYLVWSQPGKAQELVADIGLGDNGYDTAEDIRNLSCLLTCDIDSEGGVGALLLEARHHLFNGRVSEALEGLIRSVTSNKQFCDELPRKASIAVFHLLGNKHSLTQQYRRKFDMALY